MNQPARAGSRCSRNLGVIVPMTGYTAFVTAGETFGERLRHARLSAGLTQSELVERSGIPKPTLSRYENDHVLPSLQTLSRLAQALRVPEALLLPRRLTPEEELYAALNERGIVIRSRSEARRIADAVADVMRTARDTRRRMG